jgi:oxygen-independent coproporphyrinogen-3 oxidase
MCFGVLDLDALAKAYNLPNAQFAAERAQLAPLIADGIATLSGNLLRVTEAGQSLSRLVAAAFDATLQAGAGRHSRAV